MKIHLHIERLVLDGLPVTVPQAAQIRSAIQEELAQLLLRQGLSDGLRGGIALPRVHAGTIQLGPDNSPAKLGSSIGRAIHEGIGRPNDGGRRL